MKARFRVFDRPDQVAAAAAESFAATVDAALKNQRNAYVALSGGSTPKLLFELLANEYATKLDWLSVEVFFGDERCVPPDHEDSNYRVAKELLLDRVGIPDSQIHRMPADASDLDDAAKKYAGVLRSKLPRSPNGTPTFDLVWLGMGGDGHTASLFPGTEALDNQRTLVAANAVPQLDTNRMTLTYPAINAARKVQFLVCGADKASRMREVQGELDQAIAPTSHPASRVRPAGILEWVLDSAAAVELS
ncbi:MAG: 6-phosphogluconolactonase [Planctomycetota bacterium]